MQLIKITPDKVQIKSNIEQLGRISINDAMLISDDRVSLVCTVTAITRNEVEEQFDCDTGEILTPEITSTIDCSIIGSLTDGKFSKSVDIYPTTNVTINTVSDEMFRSMISNPGAGSSFCIGEYASYACAAILDGNKLFQRHSAILGNTGSGKSFTVLNILEKLSDLKCANVILFDVHGEYQNLSYVKQIKIGNGGLDFPIWFLPLKDIYGNLMRVKEETSALQVAAIRRAFYKARKSDKSEELPIHFELSDMIGCLEVENSAEFSTGEFYKTGAKAGLEKTVKGDNNGKLNGVISLLQDKQIDKRYQFMTNKQSQSYLNEFSEKVFGNTEHHIKVIDLSDVPSDMIPTIIAVTAKLIYRLQLQQNRQNIVPLSLICDEAHVYIPSSDFGLGASQRRLLDVFETIAKEGRKFGVSLMVVSQRPSDLNRTIMSQCANYIILKISNDTDKQMVKGILPESSKGLIDSVNLFSPGDCLVIGDCTPITVKVKIDLPAEKPNSNTIDTWDVWNSENEIDTDRLIKSLMNA